MNPPDYWNLVSQHSAPPVLRFELMKSFYEKDEAKCESEKDTKIGRQVYCDDIEEKRQQFASEKQVFESCATPNKVKYQYLIDTDALKQSQPVPVEFSPTRGCGSWDGQVFEAKMSSTTNIITFSEAPSTKLEFNVERATLKAGFGANRDFTCKIEDVVIKNQI